jgi:hypothetical protein
MILLHEGFLEESEENAPDLISPLEPYSLTVSMKIVQQKYIFILFANISVFKQQNQKTFPLH